MKCGARVGAAKPSTLAERLRISAYAAGFSGEEVGARLGVTGSAVRHWWAGKNEPPVSKILAYADMVDVSLDWLLRGYEDQE